MRHARHPAVLAALLLLAGCSTAPSRPISSTGTPARFATLACSSAIGSAPQPPQAVALGVVALPTVDTSPKALQTARSGDRDPRARLFAKWGLLIKVGARFELVVPGDAADRLSIMWGNPGPRTEHLLVPGCHAGACSANHGSGSCDRSDGWLAYAGGYLVRQPACMPLLVRASGKQERVLIGVGAPCPGQQPPPQPTET